MGAFIGFFSNIFGYLLNFIYEFVNNYGVAIIIFSIIIKIVLLPISIKQQKTMKKTTKIQAKSKELQAKYKSDPTKMNQEIMALYKSENMSPFSGCLSSIIQIILLFAVFFLVRSPLTYMKKTDANLIKKYTNELGIQVQNQSEQEIVTNEALNNTVIEENVVIDENKIEDANNIVTDNVIEEHNNTIIEEIKDNKQSQKNTYPEIAIIKEKGQIDERVYINMNFLGMDLSDVPKSNLNNWKVYIIPILYIISSVISLRLTTRMTKKKTTEDNKNEEVDMTAQMSKNMGIMMPILSLTVALVAPLGLALYWLVNNILMIIERMIMDRVLKNGEENEND